MTVKELIEVLQACNEEAQVYLADDSGRGTIKESYIYQSPDGSQVTIDPWNEEDK